MTWTITTQMGCGPTLRRDVGMLPPCDVYWFGCVQEWGALVLLQLRLHTSYNDLWKDCVFGL